ncbi:MAG: hypothetical protein JWM98_2160, partial [Thermoleophilia bacterium]|nr:hypothetical protein [Thermoleophilia bacterium]
MPPTPRALTVLLLAAHALCASASVAGAAPEPTVNRDLPYGATGIPALTLDAWSSAPPCS